MSKIAIQKDPKGQRTLQIFQELDRRMEEVQRRACDRFRDRGFAVGHDLDDWIAAEHEVLGWPAAELKERESMYDIEVTLPGFAPNEVEVTATSSEVIVHAASTRQRNGNDEKVIWSEFGANDVYRRFDWPQAVRADSVTAEFDNGMLRITAPKAARAKRTSVTIAAR
jgi:HSP20 family protein